MTTGEGCFEHPLKYSKEAQTVRDGTKVRTRTADFFEQSHTDSNWTALRWAVFLEFKAKIPHGFHVFQINHRNWLTWFAKQCFDGVFHGARFYAGVQV